MYLQTLFPLILFIFFLGILVFQIRKSENTFASTIFQKRSIVIFSIFAFLLLFSYFVFSQPLPRGLRKPPILNIPTQEISPTAIPSRSLPETEETYQKNVSIFDIFTAFFIWLGVPLIVYAFKTYPLPIALIFIGFSFFVLALTFFVNTSKSKTTQLIYNIFVSAFILLSVVICIFTSITLADSIMNLNKF